LLKFHKKKYVLTNKRVKVLKKGKGKNSKTNNKNKKVAKKKIKAQLK